MRYILLLLVAGCVLAGTRLTLTPVRLTDQGIKVFTCRYLPESTRMPAVLLWQGETGNGAYLNAAGCLLFSGASPIPAARHTGTIRQNAAGHYYLDIDGHTFSPCREMWDLVARYHPDGPSFSCVARDGQQGVWLNGKQVGQWYPGLRHDWGLVTRRAGMTMAYGYVVRPMTEMLPPEDHLLISPDGQRTAFVSIDPSKTGQPYRRILVVDGTESGMYDEVYLMCFSPDSRHFTCWVRQGKQWLIFTDGKQVAAYTLAEAPVTTDNRGYQIAPNGVFADNIYAATPSYETLRAWPIISPDGRHYAYVVKVGTQYRLVQDEHPGPWHDDIPVNGSAQFMTYSPDSRHFAYTVKNGERMRVVADGKPGKPYDAIMAIRYSPDSRHLGYIARQGKLYQVVVDGHEETLHPRVSQPRFSANGRFVYAWHDGTRWHMRRDGRDGPGFDDVGLTNANFAISPDGRHLAYEAVDKTDRFLVIDGKQLLPLGTNKLAGIYYSPNSRRLAYVLRDEKAKLSHLVVDGLPLNLANERLQLLGFSNDSTHVLYAFGPRDHPLLGIDDALAASPSSIILPNPEPNLPKSSVTTMGITFDSSTTFHFYAQQDGALYRVDGRLDITADASPPVHHADTGL
jgi:hypothetical protein